MTYFLLKGTYTTCILIRAHFHLKLMSYRTVLVQSSFDSVDTDMVKNLDLAKIVEELLFLAKKIEHPPSVGPRTCSRYKYFYCFQICTFAFWRKMQHLPSILT